MLVCVYMYIYIVNVMRCEIPQSAVHVFLLMLAGDLGTNCAYYAVIEVVGDCYICIVLLMISKFAPNLHELLISFLGFGFENCCKLSRCSSDYVKPRIIFIGIY